jgi:hypothetical protein
MMESEGHKEDDGGLLVGTSSEQAPGVGGVGDHPAPAAMRDPETGFIRQHGEPVNTAGNQSPQGDATDEGSGDDFLSPEARANLTKQHEPDQADTERPDIGTE